MRLRPIAPAILVGWLACGGQPPVSPTQPATNSPSPAASGCARTSVGLTPLDDLGSRLYQGQPGGLYPGGARTMPASHLSSGLSLARAIAPLDAAGRSWTDGRYVFISIGMSNTTQEFSQFKPLADADASRDPHLTIVDGAQGGVTAAQWISPGCACWTTVDQRLQSSGVTPSQVVAAWVKLADAGPTDGWPSYAQRLRQETSTILQIARSRFPNLKLVYLSSRIYAGYAVSTLNPEPYAYESGFATKWVIEDQITGSAELRFEPTTSARSPWIAWGPYLWADGTTTRSDGLSWACSDFAADGTHPSGSGREKVAQALLAFVKSDPTAREWFAR